MIKVFIIGLIILFITLISMFLRSKTTNNIEGIKITKIFPKEEDNMLNIKQRQEKLKYLGFYKGNVDGLTGPLTRKAYRDLQNKYFFRRKDKDGLYGPNTEKLLLNAYNVKKYTKNFDLKRDRLYCHCKGKYCTGYPAVMSPELLTEMQNVRNKYGPVTVNSMMRCRIHNRNVGGISNSKHMKGQAADIKNRKIILTYDRTKKFIDEEIEKPAIQYAYTDGYGRTKTRTTYPKARGMRKSIHINI